jgi:hypothetical protein
MLLNGNRVFANQGLRTTLHQDQTFYGVLTAIISLYSMEYRSMLLLMRILARLSGSTTVIVIGLRFPLYGSILMPLKR